MEEKSDVNIKIVNLSTHQLNKIDLKILKKGLKFCPPESYEHENIKDVNNFCRKLRLTEYFHDKDYNNNDLIKPQSSWTPDRGNNPDLDIAIDFLQSFVKSNESETIFKKSYVENRSVSYTHLTLPTKRIV